MAGTESGIPTAMLQLRLSCLAGYETLVRYFGMLAGPRSLHSVSSNETRSLDIDVDPKSSTVTSVLATSSRFWCPSQMEMPSLYRAAFSSAERVGAQGS